MRRTKRSGAYQIVNEINGKSYVGSAVDIDNRWSEWRANFKREMKYKCLLKAAVQRYGLEHFTFIFLEECEPTKQALEALEQYYIDLLKPAYNILAKAYSGIGNRSRTGQKHSEAAREAHRQYQKAKMANLENRARISRALTGVKKTYDVHTKGKPRPDETKRKISESNKSSSIRKQQAEARRGKPNMASSRSGEFGIWQLQGKWTVVLDRKRFGAFDYLTDAIERRDYILSLDPSQRKKHRMSVSGEYGIQWNLKNGKWTVRLGQRQYGSFDSLDDAVARRDEVLSLDSHERVTARSGKKGATGELYIRRATKCNKFDVIIDSKTYGRFATLELAIARRNYVLSVDPECRAAITPPLYESNKGQTNPSCSQSRSGEYGVTWRSHTQKWAVRLNNKKYGEFDAIEDAIERRDLVLSLDPEHLATFSSRRSSASQLAAMA